MAEETSGALRVGKPGRLERWERRVEWPLAVIASIFLAAYSVDVLAQPQGTADRVVSAVTAVAYVVFVIDYVVRLALATHRFGWFVRHLFDLAIVALPLLRPLRLLRLIVLIGALQKAVGGTIRGRVIVYTVFSGALLIYVASLAVLETERSHPGASITGFGDAVWWSIATVTTVGYGDLYPVTGTGRVIAVLLMLGGISLIGVVTATLASWIVQRVAEEDSVNRAASAAQIDELRSEIRQLAKRNDAQE
ncbi:potassium channel family protein [Rhodococcus koreensis]